MDSESNWMSDFGTEKCIVILTEVKFKHVPMVWAKKL